MISPTEYSKPIPSTFELMVKKFLGRENADYIKYELDKLVRDPAEYKGFEVEMVRFSQSDIKAGSEEPENHKTREESFGSMLRAANTSFITRMGRNIKDARDYVPAEDFSTFRFRTTQLYPPGYECLNGGGGEAARSSKQTDTSKFVDYRYHFDPSSIDAKSGETFPTIRPVKMKYGTPAASQETEPGPEFSSNNMTLWPRDSFRGLSPDQIWSRDSMRRDYLKDQKPLTEGIKFNVNREVPQGNRAVAFSSDSSGPYATISARRKNQIV